MPYKDPEKQKEYNRKYQREYRNRSPVAIEKSRAQCRDWYVRRYKTDEKYRKKRNKQRTLLRYGITEVEYDTLLVAQDDLCAICQKVKHVDEPYKRLHIDHCHDTGKVRGLLCFSCNALILREGTTPELLISSAEYLEAQCPE